MPMIWASDGILRDMKRELRREISMLHSDDQELLEAAARRNGLAAIINEMTLRKPL